MRRLLSGILWLTAMLLYLSSAKAQSAGKNDFAYLCGIDGSCIYTPAIAERYELVVTTECGDWHDQLKADNPNVMTFLYTSGTDNYTTPGSTGGWYYGPREHAWLKQRCIELGYSPEILYVHYYEDTWVSGRFFPGTYSTEITDADSVSRTPVYLGYYQGDGIGRILVNFSHPVTRQLQIEYAKKAWTDPDAGYDWPSSSTWDGYYLDNWMANELHPDMGQIGSVTSGGRLAEAPNQANITSVEAREWYQQAENQFARELAAVLHDGASWSPDGKPKYLAANVANSWTDDFTDPAISGLDYVLQEFQYNPVRTYSYNVPKAYSRDSAAYLNGAHNMYCALQTTTPSSGAGSVSLAEAALGNLAWYYITRSPSTYLFQMNANPSNYWIDVGATSWDTLSWRGCMEFDVGTSLGRYELYATGTDPVGWTYNIYKREYSNAVVFLRARNQWNEDITPQTAVPITMPTPHRELYPDGTLGPLTTSFSLANGRGLILVKEDAGSSPIGPPSPQSPSDGATLQDLRPTLAVANATDPQGRSLEYQFQMDADGNFTGGDLAESNPGEISQPTGSTTAWNLPSDLADGESWFWRARVMTTSGEFDSSAWSSPYRFSISLSSPNNCPTAPTASAPAEGATLNDQTPDLTVANATDSDGDPLTYEFAVYADAGLNTLVTSVSGITEGVTSTIWTISAILGNGQTYYWQVRANDGECDGPWSATRSFSIDIPSTNNCPAAPNASSPSNGATLSDNTPTLSVTNAVDADMDDLTYEFAVYSDAGYSNVVASASGISEGASTTSWTVDITLGAGNTYYWRARANDSQCSGDWSAGRSFSLDGTNQVPPVPVGIFPINSESVADDYPALTVQNVVDPEGDPVWYQFFLYRDGVGIDIEDNIPEDVDGTTSWQPNVALTEGYNYSWRVQCHDQTGYSGWSGHYYFVYAPGQTNSPPPAPTLHSPNDGDTLLLETLTLTVNNVVDPDGDEVTYAFTVYNDAALTNAVAAVSGVTPGAGLTSWLADFSPQKDVKYWWRARAADQSANGAWSETRDVVCTWFSAGVTNTADFSASPRTGCAPLAVSFTDLSTGDITDYTWDFGDGAQSTLAAPSHQYTQPGIYTVSLTVSGPDGDDAETKSAYITVTGAPNALFSALPRSGTAALHTQFTDGSTGATSWLWDFGDGVTSIEQNPLHTYEEAGVYDVTLTVGNTCGEDISTIENYIMVAPCLAPMAEFDVSTSTGTAPLSVTFSDQSTDNPTSWLWDFGDGNTSGAQNPTHVYAASGVFTVTLTATNSCGSDNETKVDLVTVDCVRPTAGFTNSAPAGEQPWTVTFTDQSTVAVEWNWDFGDGSISSEQNPEHIYTTEGVYTVTQTVSNACGSDQQIKTGLVTITCTEPTASFSASTGGGEVPVPVSFTDESLLATAWSWDFGDGAISTEQNPSHEYTTAGTFTVTLVAQNACGADTIVQADLISTTCTAPTAEFTSSATTGEVPYTVEFTDLSTGAAAWLWDFGDGNSSTLSNPTHEYIEGGIYTVSLIVTNHCGSDTQTKTDFVTITCTPPTASFSANKVGGPAPLTVTFTDQSTGATGWNWSFGDGGSSTEKNPAHTFAEPGTYTISLTATNQCGSRTATQSDLVTVSCVAPVAAFSPAEVFGEAPFTVDFIDQSSGATSWFWDLGDGLIAEAQNPSHTYDTAGVYTVILTALSDCGSDQEIKTACVTVVGGTTSSANQMHVNDVTLTKESWWVLRRAKASVQVLDAEDAPVKGATIVGEWSGDAGTVTRTAKTGLDGWATVRSNWKWGDGVFTYCVNNLEKTAWLYDASGDRVKCVNNLDGTGNTKTVDLDELDLDEIEQAIGQPLISNYPNPFNPTTSISFFIPEPTEVKVEVFNILGRRVKVLLDEYLSAGIHSVDWNSTDERNFRVASGVYLYRVTFDGDAAISRKMVLMK